MKHSEPIDCCSDNSKRSQRAATVLYYWTVIALIVPNILLSATENFTLLQAVATVVLPLGAYWTVISLSRRTGAMVWWLFPALFLAAFEIVLLQLYGRSVIAVDMFLNLATTNASEAGELLGNLLPAMCLVVVLYLVPLVMATVSLVRRWRVTARFLRRNRRPALGTLTAGVLLAAVAMMARPPMRPTRDLFPVNAIANAVTAVERCRATAAYPSTSAHATFSAQATHPDSLPETYIIVVGETSRGENWQLGGYGRPTNPRLSKMAETDPALFYFPKTLSESNTTHKSVPLLLSALTADNFNDSINVSKSVVTAFGEAGFETWFLSAQQHNHSYIDYFSGEADHCHYLADTARAEIHDMMLIDAFRQAIASPAPKKLIVLHTYGSHFSYGDRYTRHDAFFTPDSPLDAESGHRPQLINAYDNTIRATDRFLAVVIELTAQTGRPAALIYTSDHGEDIFDDDRNLFLHASPVPSYHQINVPMIIWLSPAYTGAMPEAAEALRANVNKNVSSSEALFQTIVSLAGLSTRAANDSCSLASPAYREPVRRYLNDHNEPVTLEGAGLDPVDFASLRARNISF